MPEPSRFGFDHVPDVAARRFHEFGPFLPQSFHFLRLLLYFDYQNSFGVVYTDLKTFGVSADLAYQIDSDFNVGLFGKYSDFSTDNGQPAWNLPEIELRAYADFDFTKNWNFSAALFYIGERTDAQGTIFIDSNSIPISSGQINTTEVEGYLDLNASLEYKINPRLAVFVNGNNLLNRYLVVQC